MERAGRYFALLGAIIGGIISFYLLAPIATLLKTDFGLIESASVVLLGAAVFAVIFLFGGPPVAVLIARGVEWLKNYVVRMPIQDIAVGVGGLIVGLIIANLITPSLARIPIVGSFLPTIAMILFGYIGLSVARSKKEDILSSLPWYPRVLSKGRFRASGVRQPQGGVIKLLDTSTIIDGRIADICRTGFIEGPIVIPNFVLDELRLIADSADNLKRNKGRRGLDILNVLQKEVPVEISIQDWDQDTEQDVDFRLIKMAKALGAKIITTDFNLAKIAEFQDVHVLNINELANSLKPIVSAGEELFIHILKEGKEPGQGVGYLEDGTMVVVEQAKRHVGDTVPVVVTNCHTTPAGRMIFAKLKVADRTADDSER